MNYSRGAEGRTRTDMKVALQQFLRLSRLPIPPLRHAFWSGRRDSNLRSPPWQGGILLLNYFRSFNLRYVNFLSVLVLPVLNKHSVNMRVCGAEAQNRTGDTRIFSPLLYQLSYLGTEIIVAVSHIGVNFI